MQKTLTSEQIQTAVSVIYRARTDEQVKLRFGTRQRSRMLELMSAKDESYKDMYRYRWLKESRNKLVEYLSKELATEFNRTYKHDAISIADLIDVAESIVLLLKANQ
jgi:hypothetical protein